MSDNFSGGTISGDVLPSATGQNLGSSLQQWNLNAQDVTVNRTFGAKSLMGRRYADQFAGSDMGAKIVAAIADLPSTGGVVDATNFSGQQTWSSNVFSGVTKPVTVLLSCQTEVDVTTTQTITSGNISIQTDCQNPWFGAGQAPQASGTRFKATANLAGPVFKIDGSATPGISGVSIGNITVDCNSNATWGFVLDTLQGSSWSGLHHVQNCTTGGLILQVSATTANVGTQINSLGSWTIHNVPIGIQLQGNDESGGPNNANTNFIDFQSVLINFTGSAGLLCHNADSNHFQTLRVYRISGVGIGVDLGGSSNQDCRDNVFDALDAGVGGLTQRTGNNGFNNVLHYIQENGAPDPTVNGSGRLIWSDGSGIKRGSFTSGFWLNDSNARAMITSGIPLYFNPTSTSVLGSDYIVNNGSSHYMNYNSALGHQFFSGYLLNQNNSGSAISYTAGSATGTQAFNSFGYIGTLRKWDVGNQVNNHFIINDGSVAGGLSAFDIAPGSGVINVPGSFVIGSAGAGGTLTNTAVGSGGGNSILFIVASTSTITSGQQGTLAGVCFGNTAYNGSYALFVTGSTTYNILPTGSETTGCGAPTPGTVTLSSNATYPLTIPALKSTTGTRYICSDTQGRLISSASACSGT